MTQRRLNHSQRYQVVIRALEYKNELQNRELEKVNGNKRTSHSLSTSIYVEERVYGRGMLN